MTCIHLWGAMATADRTGQLQYIGHECCILGHPLPCQDTCTDRKEKTIKPGE